MTLSLAGRGTATVGPMYMEVMTLLEERPSIYRLGPLPLPFLFTLGNAVVMVPNLWLTSRTILPMSYSGPSSFGLDGLDSTGDLRLLRTYEPHKHALSPTWLPASVD